MITMTILLSFPHTNPPLLTHVPHTQSFREGLFSVLVATDVAARGLDIPEVDLVVQCEPPKVSSSSSGVLGAFCKVTQFIDYAVNL